jgi:hypothetical protein
VGLTWKWNRIVVIMFDNAVNHAQDRPAARRLLFERPRWN